MATPRPIMTLPRTTISKLAARAVTKAPRAERAVNAHRAGAPAVGEMPQGSCITV